MHVSGYMMFNKH